MSALADDISFAHSVADLAGDLALSYFERGVVARSKADGTPITDADLAVERAMREHIAAERPSDAIYGEEFGRSGRSDRTWLIDPIDGTSFFAAGDPHWRVHVALQVDGETVVGVVGAPALRLRWWATRFGGSFESSWPLVEHARATTLRVSSTTELGDARVAVFPSEARSLVPKGCAVVQASFLQMVDVLRGEIDGYVVACCHAWDHAPWILLVEEAGGRFTDWSGGRVPDRGGGIFSNAALHSQLTTSWPFI